MAVAPYAHGGDWDVDEVGAVATSGLTKAALFVSRALEAAPFALTTWKINSPGKTHGLYETCGACAG